MASKKVVINADGTATVSEAKIGDAVTTVISTDTAITGSIGLLQKVALVAVGMVVQSKRKLDTWNPL